MTNDPSKPLLSSDRAVHPEEGPIQLNEEQEAAAKSWAADDHLWTTQETVQFNLRTFARVILKAEKKHDTKRNRGYRKVRGAEVWAIRATGFR